MKIVIDISEELYEMILNLPNYISAIATQAVRDGIPLNTLEQKPKTEHWIEERTYMICPNCHDIWHYEKNQTERFKFCPTCGKGLNNESKHIRNRVRNNRTN